MTGNIEETDRDTNKSANHIADTFFKSNEATVEQLEPSKLETHLVQNRIKPPHRAL